jgi:hypothetical protein
VHRAEGLLKEHSIGASEADPLRAVARAAREQVHRLETQIAAEHTRLDYVRVTGPFDGGHGRALGRPRPLGGGGQAYTRRTWVIGFLRCLDLGGGQGGNTLAYDSYGKYFQQRHAPKDWGHGGQEFRCGGYNYRLIATDGGRLEVRLPPTLGRPMQPRPKPFSKSTMSHPHLQRLVSWTNAMGIPSLPMCSLIQINSVSGRCRSLRADC